MLGMCCWKNDPQKKSMSIQTSLNFGVLKSSSKQKVSLLEKRKAVDGSFEPWMHLASFPGEAARCHPCLLQVLHTATRLWDLDRSIVPKRQLFTDLGPKSSKSLWFFGLGKEHEFSPAGSGQSLQSLKTFNRKRSLFS